MATVKLAEEMGKKVEAFKKRQKVKEEEGGQRRRQPPRTCASAGVTV